MRHRPGKGPGRVGNVIQLGDLRFVVHHEGGHPTVDVRIPERILSGLLMMLDQRIGFGPPANPIATLNRLPAQYHRGVERNGHNQ